MAVLDMVRKILRIGTVTKRQPFADAPPRYRGKIILDDVKGTDWEACVAACPTGALSLEENCVCLFYGNCIMCGACVKVCNTAAIRQTNAWDLAAMKKEDLYVKIKRVNA